MPGQLVRFAVALLVLALAAAGCASTQVVHQWSNPDVPAPTHFKKFMVIGISQQPGIRRSFEDEFVAKLRVTGVDAVPGYRFIPEDGPVEEPRLREAVGQAGADAMLVTRLVRVEQRTQMSPGYYGPGPYWGFYRGYTNAWFGYYDPYVYQYEVYISETSLYDTARNQLIWSGTVETRPEGISRDISRYVDAVIAALQKRQLLAAR
jgi:hypothetical protein